MESNIAFIALIEFLGLLLCFTLMVFVEENETEKYIFIFPFAIVNVFFFVFKILKTLCV